MPEDDFAYCFGVIPNLDLTFGFRMTDMSRGQNRGQASFIQPRLLWHLITCTQRARAGGNVKVAQWRLPIPGALKELFHRERIHIGWQHLHGLKGEENGTGVEENDR